MELIFESVSVQSTDKTVKQIIQTIANKKQKIDQQEGKIENQSVLKMEFMKMESQVVSKGKSSEKQVIIGHKIPTGVRLFTEEDIESSNFKVYDSSILRLLTKWAEELRNKIDNAEETIYRRTFKFKNNRGRLINLEPTLKKYLYNAAVKEQKKIEEYLEYLKQQNYYLQTIFSEEQNIGKYAKNDTKIGIFAAKMNEVASQYIFKYLNKLIHSLLNISKLAAEQAENDWERVVIESVDLITFKIGDMMRCKCACSEEDFIKILRVFDSLHIHSPDILKIVRIKNRMETQNNDILINLFFGSKAECELQLSVMSSHKKEESNSSKFNHLIYEITRAELGPISEMASIVVQYDPLAYVYSKSDTFGPELLKHNRKYKTNNDLVEDSILRLGKSIGTTSELPFVCNCGKLTMAHNPHFYYRSQFIVERLCNQCFEEKAQVNHQKIEEDLINKNFKEEKEKQFYLNHLDFWKHSQVLEELKKSHQKALQKNIFPEKGFLMKPHQKKPILELFTSIFQRTQSFVMLIGKEKMKRKPKLFASIKIFEEKEKTIKTIEKQLQNLTLLQFRNVQSSEQKGKLWLKCCKKGCCGQTIQVGQIIDKEQIAKYANFRLLKKSIKSQKNKLFLNYMPNCLQQLESYLKQIRQKNQIWKIKNTVSAIEAFKCQLHSIKIVGLFNQLTDLNIGSNPDIKSLRGIEECKNLRYINCNKCDIESLKQLKNLKKLETLNLANNKRLRSIESLTDHTQLLDVFLKNTPISSLLPLENCLKLESVDLQGCDYITSIKHIHSKQLEYINIVKCTGLQNFDLPEISMKALKSVEYDNNNEVNLIESQAESLELEEQQVKEERENGIGDLQVEKINIALKAKKSDG